MVTTCDYKECNNKATLKFHQLTRPSEHYFCDKHSKQFISDCNKSNIDYIRGLME